MNDQLVVTQGVELGTIRTTSPQDLVYQATSIAKTLAEVINDRKLFSAIQGRKYVRVEGWNTLGAMLGIVPREVEVIEEEDGSVLATVELVRMSDQTIVGRGSAVCGMDESTWSKRPRYARRSMAVTRATGKAFRLGFSWIMALAGYEATPAEEMLDVVEGEVIEQPKPQKKNGSKVAEPLQWLIDANTAPDVPNAAGMLNKSPWAGMSGSKIDKDELVAWGKAYRAARDEGLDSDQAAEQATTGEE